MKNVCILLIVVSLTFCVASCKSHEISEDVLASQNEGWEALERAEGAFFAFSFYDHWGQVFKSIDSLGTSLASFNKSANFSSRNEYEVFRDYFGRGTQADNYAHMESMIESSKEAYTSLVNLYDTKLNRPEGKITNDEIMTLKDDHRRYKQMCNELINRCIEAYNQTCDSISFYGQKKDFDFGFTQTQASLLVLKVRQDNLAYMEEETGPLFRRLYWREKLLETFELKLRRP